MSALDKLKSMKKGAATSSSGAKMVAETFCVTVKGYEGVDEASEQSRYVVGVRNDTGEEVRVFLRPEERPGKFARNGVQEFASYESRKKAKSATEPDGEIRFDGVFPDRDRPGYYSANWGTVTAHYKGEARSARAYVRVNKANIKEGGKASMAVDVVRTDPKGAVLVETAEDLQQAITRALTPVHAGNTAFAALRVINEGQQEFTTLVYPKRDESVDKWTALPPARSAEEFLSSEVGQGLKGVLESGEGKIEVLRGARMFVGRMTVDTALEKGKLEEADKRWRFQDGEHAGMNGFVDSWVTTRPLVDGRGNPIEPATMIVTHFAAALSNAPVLQIEDVPTANLAPKAEAAPAAPAAPVAPQRAEPAAQAAEDDGYEAPAAAAEPELDLSDAALDDELERQQAQRGFAQRSPAAKSSGPKLPF